MQDKRFDGFCFFLLGSAVFVFLGIALEKLSIDQMMDFQSIYYSARTLDEHRDPYQQTEVLRTYESNPANYKSESPMLREIKTRFLYLPSAFVFTAPIGLLSRSIAQLLWFALTGATFLFAATLVWKIGAPHSPLISGILIGFCLSNSEAMLLLGNPAGIAVSLSIIAVWCFIRQRFLIAGVICLAISLAIKPQDVGMIWLYFLLSKGEGNRRNAWQSLGVTAAFLLIGCFWVWQIAPNWIPEWHQNVLALGQHGGMNDPGPSSSGGHGLGMIISLQAAFSLLRDDPHFYNLATYAVSTPLILLWALITLRSRPTRGLSLLAIAAIATLSMLPVYHRLYDTKLIILTIPACAMLWIEGGLTGWLALGLTGLGFLLTADLIWVTLLAIIRHLCDTTPSLSGFLVLAQVFPAPLILLFISIFYLWAYWRRSVALNNDPPAGIEGNLANPA